MKENEFIKRTEGIINELYELTGKVYVREVYEYLGLPAPYTFGCPDSKFYNYGWEKEKGFGDLSN